MQTLRNRIGCWVYPIHRLDRATSGVLLFALDSEAARKACSLFEAREVEKRYLAVVRGYVPESGRIDYALREQKDMDAAEAITDYICEATVELPFPVGRYATARYSLVRALPLTGRHHQIRRHFAHISHPVVGDTSYGDRAHNRFIRSTFGIGRLLLMATDLTFRHPFNGTQITIEAPIPKGVGNLLAKFGWEQG